MATWIGYGLTATLPSTTGLSLTELAKQLRGHGCIAVFLKHLRPTWVDTLHDAGLAVYTSLGIFLGDRAQWAELPASRPIMADGHPAPAEEWYHPLSPTNTVIQARRLRTVEMRAAGLALDGLWLDFMRWPARWERQTPTIYHSSFDAWSLACFQRESGIELPTLAPSAAAAWIMDHAPEEWFAWRGGRIVDFVAAARERLHRHRPNARLGIFTIPWTDADAERLGVTQPGIRIVGQDPTMLNQVVDAISPMVYHRLCGQDDGWPEKVTAQVRRQVPDGAIHPVIEALAEDSGHTATAFARVVDGVTRAAGQPPIVFNLAGLLADPEKLAALAA